MQGKEWPREDHEALPEGSGGRAEPPFSQGGVSCLCSAIFHQAVQALFSSTIAMRFKVRRSTERLRSKTAQHPREYSVWGRKHDLSSEFERSTVVLALYRTTFAGSISCFGLWNLTLGSMTVLTTTNFNPG